METTAENQKVSRILIYEDENNIRTARDYAMTSCNYLDRILKALFLLEIGSFTINEIMSIAEQSEQGILSTIKTKMLDQVKEPLAIGGLALSKEKAMTLISAPDLSSLIHSVSDFREFKKRDFHLNGTPYGAIRHFGGYSLESDSVVIDRLKFEDFCDRSLRIFATSEQEIRVHNAVSKLVDTLNSEILGFTYNIHNASQPRDDFWKYAPFEKLKNLLGYNMTTQKFEVNHLFFK